MLLLQAYYEIDEIEPLFSLMDAFRTYLTRHKDIPQKRRRNYFNLTLLLNQAKLEIDRLQSQPSLFPKAEDHLVRNILGSVSNADISIAGPELILGKIYNKIGYQSLAESSYFRHLVISRLLFPGSKLRTVDYLYRYQQIQISVDTIYKYMDKLQSKYKDQIEQTH